MSTSRSLPVLVTLLAACGPSNTGPSNAGSSSTGPSSTGPSNTDDAESGTESETGDDGGPAEGPDAFEPFARSGTRLEHRGWVVGGGLVYDVTWDAETDASCRFVLASDGTTRCLPLPLEGLTSVLAEVYTDSECSESGRMYFQYGPLGGACSVPSLIGRMLTAAECESPMWGAEALEPAVEPAQVFWPSGGGGCSPGGNVPKGNYFQAVPLAPETFVRADLVEALTADGLGRIALEGDDGSRLLRELLDQRHGEVRLETLQEPEGDRLVPVVMATLSGVFEPACGAELVYEVPACDAGQVGGVLDSGVAYEASDIVPVDEIDAGDCGEWSEGDLDGEFFRRGQVMGDTELTRLTEDLLGEGDLQLRALATPAGERMTLASEPLRSPQGPCSPIPVGDGTQSRCLPAATAERGANYFSDPACSNPVLPVSEGLQPGDRVVARGDVECSEDKPVVGLWEVGAEYKGALFVEDGGCFEFPQGGQWVELEAIDLETLPSVEYGSAPVDAP